MFLRVTMDNGTDHAINLDKVRSLFPYKGIYLAFEMDAPESPEGDVRYTKNDFQKTVAELYDAGGDFLINAAEMDRK